MTLYMVWTPGPSVDPQECLDRADLTHSTCGGSGMVPTSTGHWAPCECTGLGGDT